jgi:hypothetical protein
MGGIPIILKTRRLLHIDIFREKTMKKCITDIYLSKTPSSRHSKRENQTNCGWLHDWAKGVTIINTMLLSEATGNKACLVLINGAIRSLLGLKDPLTANNINASRTRDKLPGMCLLQGGELLSHSSTPC